MGSELSIRASVLAFVALIGCGGFQESGGDVARATLDARGGALHLGPLTVDVPAQALDRTITFSAHAVAPPHGALHAFAVEPAGHPFLMLATVSVTVDATGDPPPADLHVALEQGGSWMPLHNRTEAADRVSGQTDATGIFGLVRCPSGACP